MLSDIITNNVLIFIIKVILLILPFTLQEQVSPDSCSNSYELKEILLLSLCLKRTMELGSGTLLEVI